MELFATALDFLKSDVGTGVLVALFTLSEALGAIPAIKANGVFQLVAGLLGRLTGRTTA